MSGRSRSLTLSAAAACESATEPRCRCRCNGSAHGKQRVKWAEDPLLDVPTEILVRRGFNALPVDDPHHVPTPAQLREKKNAARRQRRAVQLELEVTT